MSCITRSMRFDDMFMEKVAVHALLQMQHSQWRRTSSVKVRPPFAALRCCSKVSRCSLAAAANMATAKKVKISDDAAENESGVFQALEQVQQKLDQVRRTGAFCARRCRSLFGRVRLHVEIAQITDQRSDEILAVERRYNGIRRPVYLERNKVMSEVPDLWLQCMLQHQTIADAVTERDTELLSYLEEVSLTKVRTCSVRRTTLTHDVSQIDVEDFPDIKSGYKITFTFRDNPYFKNQKLVKELHYADDNALAVQGTDIEWTEEGVRFLHIAATHLRATHLQLWTKPPLSCKHCCSQNCSCADLCLLHWQFWHHACISAAGWSNLTLNHCTNNQLEKSLHVDCCCSKPLSVHKPRMRTSFASKLSNVA